MVLTTLHAGQQRRHNRLLVSVGGKYSCLENPMNSMKRQKGMTLKDELPMLVDAQYATAQEQRIKSRRNEEDEPKQKQSPIVYVTDGGSKV